MTDSMPPTVGDPAPGLDLPAVNAERVSLPDEPGRPVIISFLRHAG